MKGGFLRHFSLSRGFHSNEEAIRNSLLNIRAFLDGRPVKGYIRKEEYLWQGGLALGGDAEGVDQARDLAFSIGDRLAGLGAQFTHDLVDFRGFLFADFPRAHGGDGEFVGEPVGAERGNQADDDIDAQGLPTAARGPPNQHDDGPHQGKQQRCFQAVEMAVHPYFGIHNAHTKIAG